VTPTRDRERVMTRRDGARATLAWMAFVAASPARAYGTGGWKDCEPVCDALMDGRAKQLALQREMSGGVGDANEGEGVSAREKARAAERARARAAAAATRKK